MRNRKPDRPVWFYAKVSVPECGEAAGFELVYVFEDCTWGDTAPEGKYFREPRRIESPFDRVVGEKRLDLRGKQKPVAAKSVKKGANTESVTGEGESSVVYVPKGERPLTVETFVTVISPLLIGVDDHLGVGLRPHCVTERFQLQGQLYVVV